RPESVVSEEGQLLRNGEFVERPAEDSSGVQPFAGAQDHVVLRSPGALSGLPDVRDATDSPYDEKVSAASSSLRESRLHSSRHLEMMRRMSPNENPAAFSSSAHAT